MVAGGGPAAVAGPGTGTTVSSDDADGEPDAAWDRSRRNETPTERYDRNWRDLLQELRVVQTGVQLLTGFLLTLPFQQRFSELGEGQRLLYLATVSASIVATAFLQAPVSLHRALFRRHQRRTTVLFAHRLAIVGMSLLAAAVVGVAAIIFSVVAGPPIAAVAAAVVAALLAVLWLAVPLTKRRQVSSPRPDDARPLR